MNKMKLLVKKLAFLFLNRAFKNPICHYFEIMSDLIGRLNGVAMNYFVCSMAHDFVAWLSCLVK